MSQKPLMLTTRQSVSRNHSAHSHGPMGLPGPDLRGLGNMEENTGPWTHHLSPPSQLAHTARAGGRGGGAIVSPAIATKGNPELPQDRHTDEWVVGPPGLGGGM